MSSENGVNKTLREMVNNEIPKDNVNYMELVDEFLTKYAPRNEDGEITELNINKNKEFNEILRDNPEVLLKLLKIDEIIIPDLLEDHSVREINIVRDPLRVKRFLFKDYINKLINFDRYDENVSKMTPCVIIYYDIQKMHCLTCGEEMFTNLVDNKLEECGIDKNEIAFAFLQKGSNKVIIP